MFRLFEIAKNDWNTYYDYGSGKQKPPVKRTVFICLAAAVLALFEHSKFQGFLNAILSIEAILVGFGFSVMFFLLSEDRAVRISETVLEHRIRQRKLQTLSEEIFYNVSYFNLVSIFSLLSALLLLLPTYGAIPKYLLQIDFNWLGFELPLEDIFRQLTKILYPFFSWILWMLLYIFLALSLCTLIRTINRVHFYFSEKIALRNLSAE